MSYGIRYAADAVEDLREIYGYIAGVLHAPETAAKLVGRIRTEIRSLDGMPDRYATVEWEPWHAMGMRRLPVERFVVYYLVDHQEETVTVVRVLYGGRDVAGMVQGRQ